ncbi:FG-GAP repeat domain-containing protein [Actinoplanes sp. CA-030573]|uniref:FG-GAP repeat domain-containing protein n=1 Tax=Actinoplanes sp. CA-030573 TaxID=3239898 RepID=UPI003D91D1F9
MTATRPVRRLLTVALATGSLILTMSPAARAATDPPLPAAPSMPAAQSVTAAISSVPCDDNGATSADGDLATDLNKTLTGKLDGYMTAYRVSCARMITKAVRDRNLARRAAVIAVTTAIVESTLQNYDVAVDHDSLGLFQQRASWGSAAQRTDPIWATNAFLNKMIDKYPGNAWQTAPIGEVCQAVQVSAYPERYAPESGDAAKIVDAVWDYATDGHYDSFNGDARADMIVHGGTDVSVRFNTGSAWDGGRSVSSGWGRYHGLQVPDGLGRLYFADFNGDHRTDMIVHSGTDISVRLNTGSGFDGGRSVSSGWGRYHGMQIPNGLGRLYFADFNGDGRADMFVHGGTDLSVRLNTGSGFDGGRSVSSGWGRYHGMDVPDGLGRLYFADFNGDGRADLIVHGGTDVSVRLNTGSGFDGGWSVSSGWGRYHGLQVPNGLGRLYFADFNGDHRTDMIVHSGTDVSVRLNTGSGFDGGRSVSSGWGRYHGMDIPDGLGRLYFAS